jgi:hypothetical protein
MRRSTVIPLLGCVASVAVLGTPAQAAPPERTPFAIPSTLPCGSFTAEVQISGVNVVHTTPAGADGERTITVLQDVRSVFTNPDTGATVEGRRNGVVIEVTDADGGVVIKEVGVILRRIAGEGNAIPFAGQFTVEIAANGDEVVIRDVGLREDAFPIICAALAP